MRYGCRWFQSQVVRRIPGYCVEYLQRLCKQLVVCALCTPFTRFPQVSFSSVYERDFY